MLCNGVLIVVAKLYMLKAAIFVPVVAGLRVIAQYVKVCQRKELKMYQPELEDNLIRTIYRVKRAYKKPMTRVAENLMQQGLNTVDREQVCKVCMSEGNNDCSKCYFSKKGGHVEKHY